MTISVHHLATRQRIGVVHLSVTHRKDHVAILEAKETLTNSDHLTVEHILKKLEALDAEFNDHHYTVIDHVGDD